MVFLRDYELQHNINLDNNFDNNVDEDDTIILIRHLAWHIKSGKQKELKKLLSEELMPVAWYPNRWWDWCRLKDEKKEKDSMFIKEL